MQHLLAQKQSNNEKRLNENARSNFLVAMLSADHQMIGDYLMDNTLYMGKYNKHRMQHWFKKLFAPFYFKEWNSDYEIGISLDFFPGSEMFEFKYALNEPDFHPLIPQAPIKYELILHLTLAYDKGKIKDIRVTKHFNLFANLEHFTTCN